MNCSTSCFLRRNAFGRNLNWKYSGPQGCYCWSTIVCRGMETSEEERAGSAGVGKGCCVQILWQIVTWITQCLRHAGLFSNHIGTLVLFQFSFRTRDCPRKETRLKQIIFPPNLPPAGTEVGFHLCPFGKLALCLSLDYVFRAIYRILVILLVLLRPHWSSLPRPSPRGKKGHQFNKTVNIPKKVTKQIREREELIPISSTKHKPAKGRGGFFCVLH